MKTLVAYFSATGTTKQKAEQLAQKIGADLYEIEPKIKYTKEDLDWMNTKARSSIEGKDEHIRPELKEEKVDLDAYDEIYLVSQFGGIVHRILFIALLTIMI